MPDTKLLTPREVRERLRCRLEDVYELLEAGHIRHIRNGRNFKVPDWAVEEYIKKQAM